MAKRSQMNQLLGETDPASLQQLAAGSFLAVFVFAGAFLVADTTAYLVSEQSTLTASVISFDIGEYLCFGGDSCR